MVFVSDFLVGGSKTHAKTAIISKTTFYKYVMPMASESRYLTNTFNLIEQSFLIVTSSALRVEEKPVEPSVEKARHCFSRMRIMYRDDWMDDCAKRFSIHPEGFRGTRTDIRLDPPPADGYDSSLLRITQTGMLEWTRFAIKARSS